MNLIGLATSGASTSAAINHGRIASVDNMPVGSVAIVHFINAVTNDRTLVTKVNSSGVAGWSLVTRAAAGSAPRVNVSRATTAQSINGATGTYVTGFWYFTVGIWDITGGLPRIYAGEWESNLLDVSSSPTAGSGAQTDDSANSIFLGNYTGASNSPDGTFAALALWPRILSLDEATWAKENILRSVGLEASSPKLWTRYGDNGTGSQYDLSGNGLNGTLSGTWALASASALRRRPRKMWSAQYLTLLSPTVAVSAAVPCSVSQVASYGAAGSGASSATAPAAVSVSTLASYAVNPPTITLDETVTYQIMYGWQAAGAGDTTDANFSLYRDALHTDAVDNLGIDRIRLEITKVQDAAQDHFVLANIASAFNSAITAFRQKVLDAGKQFYLDVCVVGGGGTGTKKGFSFNSYGAGNAAAFASAMAEVYGYIYANYGFYPDTWEILEPDTFGWLTGVGLTAAGSIPDIFATTYDALVAAGLPYASGFSSYSTAVGQHNEWINTYNAGASSQRTKLRASIAEYIFHDYGDANDASLATAASDLASAQAVATVPGGISSAMLERTTADYIRLHRLLSIANISSFQQYTMAFNPGSDNGAQYYVTQATSPYFTIASRTKLLRQYFLHIRPYAVRYKATSLDANFDAVAFRNADGSRVVVVKALAAGQFTISGLPAGIVSARYSTASAYDQLAANFILPAGGSYTLSIPAAGALTIFEVVPAVSRSQVVSYPATCTAGTSATAAAACSVSELASFPAGTNIVTTVSAPVPASVSEVASYATQVAIAGAFPVPTGNAVAVAYPATATITTDVNVTAAVSVSAVASYAASHAVTIAVPASASQVVAYGAGTSNVVLPRVGEGRRIKANARHPVKAAARRTIK